MELVARIESALPSTPQIAGQSSAAAAGPDWPVARARLPATATIPLKAGHAPIRPAATFLAHLIATEAQMPQTRARRRAEPDAAAAIYADAIRVNCGSTGTVCARDI
jgi:hypothetical protein